MVLLLGMCKLPTTFFNPFIKLTHDRSPRIAKAAWWRLSTHQLAKHKETLLLRHKVPAAAAPQQVSMEDNWSLTDRPPARSQPQQHPAPALLVLPRLRLHRGPEFHKLLLASTRSKPVQVALLHLLAV